MIPLESWFKSCDSIDSFCQKKLLQKKVSNSKSVRYHSDYSLLQIKPLEIGKKFKSVNHNGSAHPKSKYCSLVPTDRLHVVYSGLWGIEIGIPGLSSC